MKEIIYNKLVRDKIPNIIEADNKKYLTEIVKKDELKELLNKKLREEVEEYIESNDIEEIADILEVIYAIIENNNVSKKEVEKIRKNKKEKRGGFNEGIKLIKVIE
ncbi:MAG: phosphoribosyl-ATP pyrophosphohydrolase [Firmicutes bacterium]|nr:phosphoribosyl-ATP pyrophosphohydrolase [Bacillota bacterium]